MSDPGAGPSGPGSPLSDVAESLADAAQARPRDTTGPTTVRSTRDFGARPHIPLADVASLNPVSQLLDARRSIRSGGAIAVASLASLLLASNRVITFGTADDGYTRSWRPNPSAGGRHPIDILVDARQVNGLDPGAYWFDAVHWSLRPELDLETSLINARAATADAVATESPPGAILFLVAQFERTGSRYDHPASLVWRDAGALLATVQFAATGVGLSSCAAGISGTLSLPDGGVDVGAVVLGPGVPA